jgi:cell division inhibitor SulA/protein ImuA
LWLLVASSRAFSILYINTVSVQVFHVSSAVVPNLEALLRRQDLWRLDGHARRFMAGASVATGHAALDRILHSGGWPRAALTELLLDRSGSSELQLLLPVLAELSREQRWQVWINPPFIPYAPALSTAGIAPESLLIVRTEPKQQLWACEQALRSAASGAVLYWPALPLRYAELRKLQVAAASQRSFAFLFRATSNAAHTSPAALRLQLAVAGSQLVVDVLKQRGGRSGQRVLLPQSVLLREQAPVWQCNTLVSDDMAHEHEHELAAVVPDRGTDPGRRRIIGPIAARRSLPRSFSVRSERRALH